MAEPAAPAAAPRDAADERDRASLRLVKNTATLVSLRVFVPLLSVALMLVLSRQLGADGIGRYTLVYGYLALFNTVATLGLYPVISRDGARQPQQLSAMLGAAFTLGGVCSLLMTALMAGAGLLFDYDAETRLAMLILSLAILPYSCGFFIEAACVALQRTDYYAAASLVEYLLKVGLGVALLWQGYGLDAVLLVAVVGRVLGCAVGLWLLARAGVAPRWWFGAAMLRRLLGLAPTFLAISVFATLYWRVDILMLSALGSIAGVGYYGASWRLLEFAMVVPTSLCLALYPQITLLLAQDRRRLAALARVTLRYLFALTLPVAMTVSLISEPLLVMLFGAELRPAAATLAVLVWTLLPYCWVRYHAFALLAGDRQRVDLMINVVMSLVNVGLNLLLIPLYGPLGAALATLTAIVAYAAVQFVYLRLNLPHAIGRFAPSLIVVLAAAVSALAAAWLAQRQLVLALLLAPPLYIVLLLLGGFFSRGELNLLGLEKLSNRLSWLRA